MFPQISTCRLCSDVCHRFRSICLIVRYIINNVCNSNGLLKSGGYGDFFLFIFLSFLSAYSEPCGLFVRWLVNKYFVSWIPCRPTLTWTTRPVQTKPRPLFSVTCVTKETGNTLRMRVNNAFCACAALADVIMTWLHVIMTWPLSVMVSQWRKEARRKDCVWFTRTKICASTADSVTSVSARTVSWRRTRVMWP